MTAPSACNTTFSAISLNKEKERILILSLWASKALSLPPSDIAEKVPGREGRRGFLAREAPSRLSPQPPESTCEK
jgi:hypothetical protein